MMLIAQLSKYLYAQILFIHQFMRITLYMLSPTQIHKNNNFLCRAR